MMNTCPSCGYCPCCGRSAQPPQTYPTYPLYPGYPGTPWPVITYSGGQSLSCGSWSLAENEASND